MTDIDQPDEGIRRSLYIFNRDVSKIPCFRSSFLYGIGTGVAIGLMAFMSTSKPRLASHVGFSTFVLTTVSYWCYCRYAWAKQKALVLQIQEGMRQNAYYEGTDLHRQINEEFKAEAKEA